MTRAPNVNALPSGTGVHLIVIIAANLQLSLWLGSFLPSEIDFVPLNSVRQPGLYNTDSSLMGVAFCGILACIYAIAFIIRRKKAFGPYSILPRCSAAYQRIDRLNVVSQKPVRKIYVGGTIFDTDALAFGFGPWRSILIGRGFEALATLAPNDFDIRFSHELAHFENRDTINGLVGLSLLAASGFILGLVAVWQLVRPAIRIYLHGDSGAWINYNFYKSLGSLSMLLPGGLFWLAIILIEFLALLRLREVLADARAAFNGHQNQMLATLSAEKQAPDWYPALLLSHPNVKQRLAWCTDPIAMYRSSLWRFFAVGFFFAVSIYQTKTSLQMGVVLLGNPKCETLIQCASLIKTNTIFYMSTWFVFTLFSVTLAFLSLSLSLSLLIRQRGAVRLTFAIIFCTVAVSLGYAFGELMHPFDFNEQQRTASVILRGGFAFPNFYHAPQASMFNRLMIFAGSHLISVLIITLAVAVIVKGSRGKPISSFGWLALITTSILITNSILAIIGTLLLPEAQAPPPGYYAGIIGFFVLYLLVLMLLIWRFTRGIQSCRNWRPEWLYAQNEPTGS